MTTPLHLVITRRSGTYSQSPSSVKTTSKTVRSLPADVQFNEGEHALRAAQGVGAVKEGREQERKDLQDLNDRFSNYLGKVRELEAQNRKLADDLEKLRAKWGVETRQIKAMFQAELDEARHQLDEAEREKARLEIKLASLEEQLEELRSKLTIVQLEITAYKEKVIFQNKLIEDYELEIQLLRKQVESLENEHDKDKKTIEELEERLRQAREDLDNETLAHIDAENRRQTIEEEIEFLKSIHDQEMKELAALAYRDTTNENRDFWKNELANAIREIEQMYSEKMEDMKIDLETTYKNKLDSIRLAANKQANTVNQDKDECKDLRKNVTDLRDKINDLDKLNQDLQRQIDALKREKEDREREIEAEIDDLRDQKGQLKRELDAIIHELQNVADTKMSLDLEIAAYRKLLEGEERRANFDKPSKPGAPSGSQPGGQSAEPPTDDPGSFGSGVMSAKTTYQRTAKGTMAVADCPPDGRCVRLENTGKKEENIEGWSIVRNVDGREQQPYVLGPEFSAIQPGQKITIFAQGYKPASAPRTDIEMDSPTWGIGSQVVTRLYNEEGEERASLTQKTVYTS